MRRSKVVIFKASILDATKKARRKPTGIASSSTTAERKKMMCLRRGLPNIFINIFNCLGNGRLVLDHWWWYYFVVRLRLITEESHWHPSLTR